jgi:hypothetical protein
LALIRYKHTRILPVPRAPSNGKVLLA